MHGSDVDWVIGFGGVDTANENEYDPKTGKLMKNDTVGNHTSYLNQWDADNTPYLEKRDKERDNTGFGKIVMQQLTPIK